MKNQRVLIITTLVLIFIALFVIKRRIIKKNNSFTIGIIQTASHPALDAVRDGFITQIQAKTKEIDFVIRNGQGSINTIHSIAQQCSADTQIDAVFAIATPAAQAITTVEKEKPIIVAAVTVAPELGLTFNQDNVCGVSDMIDISKEIEAMHILLPEAKNIGILFCTAEINSVAMTNIMVQELERIGLNPVLVGVTSEVEMETALLSAVRKVDAIIAPTDNVVANTIALLVDITKKAKKPLIVSDNLLVQQGALMARGVDYYKSGMQAGDMALELLIHKKRPYELSIVRVDNNEIYVSKNTANYLGISLDTMNDDMIMIE